MRRARPHRTRWGARRRSSALPRAIGAALRAPLAVGCWGVVTLLPPRRQPLLPLPMATGTAFAPYASQGWGRGSVPAAAAGMDDEVGGAGVLRVFGTFPGGCAGVDGDDEGGEGEEERGGDPQVVRTAGRLVYVEALERLRRTEETTFVIEYVHLLSYSDELAEALLDSFYRFEPYLRRALFEFVRRHMPGLEMDPAGRPRMFWVSLCGLPHVRRLRDLRSDRIGALVSFSGTVTRTSEVRPELLVGTFVCDECGHEVTGVEQQNRYTEPPVCPSPDCGNHTAWKLVVERSKFVDWQRVRVQEHATEIPAGALPRTLDVIVRHENVERAKAGDKCTFTGTLVVVPEAATLAGPGERVEA
eukprot:ctg_372.g232